MYSVISLVTIASSAVHVHTFVIKSPIVYLSNGCLRRQGEEVVSLRLQLEPLRKDTLRKDTVRNRGLIFFPLKRGQPLCKRQNNCYPQIILCLELPVILRMHSLSSCLVVLGSDLVGMHGAEETPRSFHGGASEWRDSSRV